MVLDDFLNSDELSLSGLLVDVSEDLEPAEDGPQTVLLSHVIATCAKALLTTDGNLARVKQVAEELPAGRSLEAIKAEFLANVV